MCLKGRKLKTNEKIKESFLVLLKKAKQLITTPLFLEVVSGFKKKFFQLLDSIDSMPRSDFLLFLSVVMLSFIVVLLFMLIWAICLFTV